MVEEEPYELHLPPQNELVGVAERNRRVLGNYVAVTSALLYRTDSLVAIKRSSSNNNDKQDGDTNTCVSLCLRGKRGSSLESMDPVTVTSVHLDATSEKKRVGQLAQCLRRARAVPGDTAPLQSISTILAGDMNQELFPGSCVRAFLADSNTEPTDDEMERECASDLRLNKEATPTKQQLKEWRNLHAEAADTAYDCCVALDRIDSGPTRAGYDRADPSSTEVRMAQWRLDHILYTSETLRPVASWSTLEDDPESCRTGLPNRKYGSDHVPVGALFRVLPTPQLPPEERMSLLSSLEKLLDGQKAALHEQETALDSDLARIELDVLPKENPAGSSTGKKNKKKGKPPPEIMDFMRRKRTVVRELKAEQREERRAFVKGLGNLQRLLIEETYGCTARQWVERV
jgi:endonuclease/exonuclease/phosphatase family metal-dependent hydrolase